MYSLFSVLSLYAFKNKTGIKFILYPDFLYNSISLEAITNLLNPISSDSLYLVVKS